MMAGRAGENEGGDEHGPPGSYAQISRKCDGEKAIDGWLESRQILPIRRPACSQRAPPQSLASWRRAEYPPKVRRRDSEC
jgi:hypothetical protein